MQVELPQAVQPLLDTYIHQIDEALPGLLSGLYLHGSIALGAFDPQLSDVDFIAVLSRPCTEDDIDHLRSIHLALATQYSRPAFEGSYLQPEQIGQRAAETRPIPYHHDGQFHAAGHFEINGVTWWVLKTRGFTLRGPQPADLPFDIDWDSVIAEMRENMNSYWVRWTREPRLLAALLFDGGISWAVLGVLRQYYSFTARDITSKSGAGNYALTRLPQWQRIIQEALNIRARKPGSLYRSKALRALDAVRFMRYIIRWCNANT